jgi:hypothetical protein
MDGFEYKDNVIERIHHTEGVITQRAKRADESSEFVGAGGLVWQYEYVLKDHLGNTRVTFADINGNGLIDPLVRGPRLLGVFGSTFILLPTAKNARRSRAFLMRCLLLIASPTRDNCNTILHKFFDILGIYTEGSCSMQKVVQLTRV